MHLPFFHFCVFLPFCLEDFGPSFRVRLQVTSSLSFPSFLLWGCLIAPSSLKGIFPGCGTLGGRPVSFSLQKRLCHVLPPARTPHRQPPCCGEKSTVYEPFPPQVVLHSRRAALMVSSLSLVLCALFGVHSVWCLFITASLSPPWKPAHTKQQVACSP